MSTPETQPPARRSWALIALAGVAVLGLAGYAIWASQQGPERRRDEPPAPREPREEFARIPKIDVHVHIAPRLAADALRVLREHGIAIAINASGGVPGGGAELSSQTAEATDGGLLFYCNFPFNTVEEPDFATFAVELLETCKRLGAKGLKIFKSLGLGITLADGTLLAVDDPRLDVLFEKAGELGLPVLIHSGDPVAFFRPPTEDNERFEELRAHPEWSFHGNRPDNGQPWPSWEDVFSQFERRIARHPRTKFLGAHFGNAPEDPERIARMLERYPNLYVETGARVPEIGRHPADRMRRIFERFPDRILFGTDFAYTPDGLTLGSRGDDHDRPEDVPRFFAAHWRYFETSARGLAHPTPIQGRWTIDGIGLPRPLLEKLYWRNAAALFGLSIPREFRYVAPAQPTQ